MNKQRLQQEIAYREPHVRETPRLRLALQLADAAFAVRSWIGDDTTPSEDATYRGVATMLDESARLLRLVDELDGLPDDAIVRKP